MRRRAAAAARARAGETPAASWSRNVSLVEVRQPDGRRSRARSRPRGRCRSASRSSRRRRRRGPRRSARSASSLQQRARRRRSSPPEQRPGAARRFRSASSRGPPLGRSCWRSCPQPVGDPAAGGVLAAFERRGDLAVGEVGGVSAARPPSRWASVSAATAAQTSPSRSPSPPPLGSATGSGRSLARLRAARPGAVVVDRLAAGDRHHPGARVGAVHAVVARAARR